MQPQGAHYGSSPWVSPFEEEEFLWKENYHCLFYLVISVVLMFQIFVKKDIHKQ